MTTFLIIVALVWVFYPELFDNLFLYVTLTAFAAIALLIVGGLGYLAFNYLTGS